MSHLLFITESEEHDSAVACRRVAQRQPGANTDGPDRPVDNRPREFRPTASLRRLTFRLPGRLADRMPTGLAARTPDRPPGRPGTVQDRSPRVPFGHRAWLRPDLDGAQPVTRLLHQPPWRAGRAGGVGLDVPPGLRH